MEEIENKLRAIAGFLELKVITQEEIEVLEKRERDLEFEKKRLSVLTEGYNFAIENLKKK